MNPVKILSLCAIFIASNLAILSTTAEAEACSPAMGTSLVWTLPEEGGTIQGDDPILMMTMGGGQYDETVSLLDDGGAQVPMSVETRSTAGFFEYINEILPEEFLEAGNYTVLFEYPESGADSIELNFEVTADQIGTLPVPGAVDFHWFQETYAVATGNSCNYGDEYNQLIIEPLDIEPAYYEILFGRDEAANTPHLLLPAGVDGELSSYEVTDVDCVTIFAVAADGTEGEATEICKPDKCNHFEEPVPFQFGTSEWDDVSGCGDDEVDPNPDAGTGGEPDAGSDGDAGTGSEPDAGTWVDPEPQPDAGTSIGGDVGTDEDAGSNPDLSEGEESGCASVPGSTPPVSLLVLVAMMVGVRRFSSSR